MRLCILTTEHAWGGAEVHTLKLSRTLASRGHDVLIYDFGHRFYERARLESHQNIRVIPVKLSKPVAEFKVFDWLRLFRTMKSDGCLFAKGTFDSGSWQLEVAARLSFPRLTTIEHLACPPMPNKLRRRHLGGVLPGLGVWWYRLLAARRFRSVAPHRVICVSHAVQQQLAEHYRFPSRKLVTIHNGIDPNTFQRLSEARHFLRAAWGIPYDALVFGSVGRLHTQKGYDVALDVFHRLVSSMPKRDLRFVLVGEGPLREDLQRFADDAGLQGRFLLLDFTPRPWEAYSAFDIFLMPSRNEGLPLALLEAMACYCCPIAMRVGGVPEVLTDPRLGWLVEPEDRRGFLKAMRAAAQASPEERLEMASRAREHVITRFNAEVQFSMIADFLEQECGAIGQPRLQAIQRSSCTQ